MAPHTSCRGGQTSGGLQQARECRRVWSDDAAGACPEGRRIAYMVTSAPLLLLEWVIQGRQGRGHRQRRGRSPLAEAPRECRRLDGRRRFPDVHLEVCGRGGKWGGEDHMDAEGRVSGST